MRKWRRDNEISTGKKGCVNVRVCPGSISARAAGKRSTHQGCSTAASATARCKISAVSVSQQLGTPIWLLIVGATRKNKAQHDEENRLQFFARKQCKKKGPNIKKGKEKKSIDLKRAFARKVEGIYNSVVKWQN